MASQTPLYGAGQQHSNAPTPNQGQPFLPPQQAGYQYSQQQQYAGFQPSQTSSPFPQAQQNNTPQQYNNYGQQSTYQPQQSYNPYNQQVKQETPNPMSQQQQLPAFQPPRNPPFQASQQPSQAQVQPPSQLPQTPSQQPQMQFPQSTPAFPAQRTAGFQIPPYQPPSTPEEIERERARISLLLEINNEVMQHAAQLQAEGQGGIIPPNGQSRDPIQQDAAGALAGGQKPASGDYLKCMRTLQANMQYLSTANTYQSTRPKNASTMAGPAIMDAPVTNAPKITELYDKLRSLFPGWKGLSFLALANAQGVTRGSASSGIGQQAAAQVQGLLNQTPSMSQQQVLPQQQAPVQTPYTHSQANVPSYTPQAQQQNYMQSYNNQQMQSSMGYQPQQQYQGQIAGSGIQQQPFTGQMMGPGQGLAQGIVGRMSQQHQGQGL